MQASRPVNAFFALVPPPALLRPLADAVAPLRDQVGEVAWVSPARWHVTVRFVGRVDPAPLVRSDIRLPGDRPTVVISGAGTFGGRVLWAGVTGVPAAVLRAVGADPTDVTLHLTLGRARGRRGWSGLRAVAGQIDFPELRWQPDRVVLMRSVPGQPYEELAAWAWS